MKEQIKEKIIENFYRETEKYFNQNIVLEDCIIGEIINLDNKIYSDNRNTKILKKRIGVYDGGKIVSIDHISEEFSVSKQRISQIIKNIIEIIYKKDVEIKSEIIRNNPNIKREFIEYEIVYLEFDKQKTEILKTKGYLKEEFYNDELNYKEIKKRINLFGLEFKQEKIGTPILEEDISEETYLYLKTQKIYTYEELNEKKYYLTKKYRIPTIIKLEILDLCKQMNQKDSQNMSLLRQQQKLESNISKLSEIKENLQVQIDKIIHNHNNSEKKEETLKKLFQEEENITILIKIKICKIEEIKLQIQNEFNTRIPQKLKKQI